MRSSIITLSFAFGCGSVHSNPVDGSPDTQVDTPGSTTTVTLTTFRPSGPANSQLVAVQDGEGPWTVVSGTAGVYTAMVHSDHFGLTVACTGDLFSSVFTIYAAISDGTSWYVADCNVPAANPATISGNVTGAANTNATRVVNGFDSVDLPAGTTAYSLPTSPGPTRLFAEELVTNRPIKLASVDTTVVDGGTANFNLASGFAPVTHALAAANGTLATANLAYRDIHTIALLDRPVAPIADYRGVPADQLGNGLNRLSVAAPSTQTSSQNVIRYFKTPVDQAITLPPALQLAAAPTATRTPYPTGSAKVPEQPGVTLYTIDFATNDLTTNTGHDFFAEMTAAYVAKAYPGGTISYAMPDFTGLAGWQATFQLEVGLPIDFQIQDQTNVNIDLFNAVPPNQFPFHDNGEEKLTTANGQIAAP